jgi:aminoglycoside 3-N-acetyltransferase I
MKYSYRQLQATDTLLFQDLLKLFAEVFEDPESYQSNIPDVEYIRNFLLDDAHIVLVAETEDGGVVGGLVAYELQKFEQRRSELYIYDLAVAGSHQRQHVGTNLLETLKQIALDRGIHTVFVQADKEDSGAIAFYRTLSSDESEGYVFDIVYRKE